MTQGMFITFEGGEKTGKSTQLRRLVDYLGRQEIDHTATHEPGGTQLGERLREVLLHDRFQAEMTAVSEALLYAASRGQLVSQRIRPALAADHVVVSDRYVDSSLAYQGYGLGLDLDFLRRINTEATGGLTPDLTLLFDNVDVDEGRRRGGSRSDRIERRGEEFHRRVCHGYRELAEQEPERFHIIDGARPVKAVWAEVVATVAPRLRAAGWDVTAGNDIRAAAEGDGGPHRG